MSVCPDVCMCHKKNYEGSQRQHQEKSGTKDFFHIFRIIIMHFPTHKLTMDQSSDIQVNFTIRFGSCYTGLVLGVAYAHALWGWGGLVNNWTFILSVCWSLCIHFTRTWQRDSYFGSLRGRMTCDHIVPMVIKTLSFYLQEPIMNEWWTLSLGTT